MMKFLRVKTPPDAAVAELNDTAASLMGFGKEKSCFTAVVVIGAYQIGTTEENAQMVSGGACLKHPQYQHEAVPILIARLRQVADELERDQAAAVDPVVLQ